MFVVSMAIPNIRKCNTSVFLTYFDLFIYSKLTQLDYLKCLKMSLLSLFYLFFLRGKYVNTLSFIKFTPFRYHKIVFLFNVISFFVGY